MAAFFSARKAVASLLVPSTTFGSMLVACRNSTSCDAGKDEDELCMENRLAGKRGVILRKRMTPIGRFSLKSETPSNPSVPTFFLALSGEGNSNNNNKNNNNNSNKNNTNNTTLSSEPQSGLTVTEFQSAWLNRGMPDIHPRFHSTVSKDDDRYFELKPGTKKGVPAIQLSRYTSETLHTYVYREDLKKRIETLLMTPIDVFHKLWEVQISNGTLGTSGAIDKTKVQDIRDNSSQNANKLIETLLLFRCHHSLGDAISLTAAIGDLLDEAQEIRKIIKEEINKRMPKGKDTWMLVKLFRFFQKLAWLLIGSLRAVLHHAYLMFTTRNNPFLEVLGRTSSEGLQSGRSASWCDFASVDEVKLVAKAIGPKVTLNDVFVSCVTAAVARQLTEHREKAINLDAHNERTSTNIQQQINVVIPAHLTGGVLLPNQQVGNLIGAFVARVPGEMNNNASASDRLCQVHSSLYPCRRSPARFISYYTARMASSWLPNKWASRLLLSGNANAAVVVSNSRGLTKKVHINGRPVESMVGFIPLPPGLPVGVSILSYDSVVSLSVSAEKWAVPDADKFLGWILDEYKLLCKEADMRQH